MSTSTGIPDLKRIEFFTGQRLTAQDMTDEQDVNRELRWLHNRSLHGWGIGIGYGVAGEAGDTKVIIAPGYAIDCLGRELILTTAVTMTVPATAGIASGSAIAPAIYYLTASYLDDAGQGTVERRPGVCLPAGTVRLTEGPLLEWRQFKDVQNGINVILAEASILNCQLNAPLGLNVRRPARPPDQPHIAAGQLAPPVISWLPVAGGIRAHIDTSAAQFRSVPAYFAHVMGPRQIALATGAAGGQLFLVTVPLVSNPTPAAFDCDVLLLMFNANNAVVGVDPSLYGAIIGAIQWTVVWMGVEG